MFVTELERTQIIISEDYQITDWGQLDPPFSPHWHQRKFFGINCQLIILHCTLYTIPGASLASVEGLLTIKVTPIGWAYTVATKLFGRSAYASGSNLGGHSYYYFLLGSMGGLATPSSLCRRGARTLIGLSSNIWCYGIDLYYTTLHHTLYENNSLILIFLTNCCGKYDDCLIENILLLKLLVIII